MRKLEIGQEKYTQVYACDEKGQGNANYHYSISSVKEPSKILGEIKFQNGPILEIGINGVMNEDLLAIVLDRLQCFNSSNYCCRENSCAITKIEEALMWLNERTKKRERRNVEGTHIV